MSKRPPHKRPAAAAPPSRLSRRQFPALIDFVRGYLHEDSPVVHGSVRAAAAAFRADASPEERRRLAREIAALAAGAASLPLKTLREFVTKELGSAWIPRSRDELEAMLDELQEK